MNFQSTEKTSLLSLNDWFRFHLRSTNLTTHFFLLVEEKRTIKEIGLIFSAFHNFLLFNDIKVSSFSLRLCFLQKIFFSTGSSTNISNSFSVISFINIIKSFQHELDLVRSYDRIHNSCLKNRQDRRSNKIARLFIANEFMRNLDVRNRWQDNWMQLQWNEMTICSIVYKFVVRILELYFALGNIVSAFRRYSDWLSSWLKTTFVHRVRFDTVMELSSTTFSIGLWLTAYDVLRFPSDHVFSAQISVRHEIREKIQFYLRPEVRWRFWKSLLVQIQRKID